MARSPRSLRERVHRGGAAGDAVELRQPAQQRRALSRGAARLSRAPRRDRAASTGCCRTRHVLTTWSTASRRARHPTCAERVKAATGWDDRAPVMGERFIQWVIEDHFIAGRPAWESVGVEMVASVLSHEEAKIRVLNASHSCIAWAGTLRGLTFIHEGVQVPEIRQLAYDYVTDDVIPCLDTPEHRARSTCGTIATWCSSASATPGCATPTSASRWTASRRFWASSCRRCANAWHAAPASPAPRCCRRCSLRCSAAGTAASSPTPTRTV